MNLKICRINKKSTKKNLENLNFFFIRQTADKKGKKSLFKLLSMKSKYLKFRFFRGFLNAKYTLKSKKNDPFFSFILSNKNNYFYFFII